MPREQRGDFNRSSSKLSQIPNDTVRLIGILLFCLWMSPRAKCQRSSALSTLQHLSISLRDLMELNTPSEVKTCQLCGLRNMIGLHSWCPYVSEKSQLGILLKAQLLQVLGVKTLSSGFTDK